MDNLGLINTEDDRQEGEWGYVFQEVVHDSGQPTFILLGVLRSSCGETRDTYDNLRGESQSENERSR